jgi:uncharacterized protein
MLDFDRVEAFEWDDGNARKSVDRHDVTAAEAEQIFFDERSVVTNDLAHSASESRFHALGRTEAGRSLHITFTLRRGGTRIRVISARDMNRRGRRVYAEKA